MLRNTTETTVTTTGAVYREVDGEELELEVQITGYYAYDGLEDFEVELLSGVPGLALQLTEAEEFRLLDLLEEERYYHD